jgi:serine acetyltransferase
MTNDPVFGGYAKRVRRLASGQHPSVNASRNIHLSRPATGIIVGAFVEIGDEATIMQGVTVGRKIRSTAARRGSAGACCFPRV